MKISLRWVCSHIDADWRSLNINDLIARFNTQVAEIEHYDVVSHPMETFFMACFGNNGAIVPENGERVACERTDAVQGGCFLVKREDDGYRWATLRDFGMDKDGLLPQLQVHGEALTGGWREQWERDDIILDVDNKSVTHRPDMWGHRGFAREIAAMMGLSFKEKEEFLMDPRSASGTTGESIALVNNAPEHCSMLAGLHIPHCQQAPSDITMVSRFVKIGYRPHSAVVDVTNYVMADWGHPMHAYDEKCIEGGLLQVRMAAPSEELILLDDSVVKLNENDIVIGDQKKVLGLAGVMGGKDDSMHQDTTSIFLEAACFSAAHIRRSAARHKSRTEASQRFEKTLDPMMAIEALQRFVMVAREIGLVFETPHAIQAEGKRVVPPTLQFTHSAMVRHLGIDITVIQVCASLEPLEFEVTVEREGREAFYTVVVPTFRASKDIKIVQDLYEEIARRFGFENIPANLPALASRPTNLRPKGLMRRVKEHLALAGMSEQRNYAFFDETVLKKFGWTAPQEALRLKNPVSENSVQLIDTLLPHLLKNIATNSADYDSLRFFEWGRVWKGTTQESERDALAMVWYEKRAKLDFFDLKRTAVSVCKLAHVTAAWEKCEDDLPQWALAGRCARLVVDGTVLGYFGQLDPIMVQKCGGLPESTMFACEFNASLFIEAPEKVYRVTSDDRYQGSQFDISAMVPLHKTVAQLEAALAGCSPHIVRVRLIDFFEKKEWVDQRSVAFRMWLRHPERSLHKEEIEQARQAVIACVEQHEGVLRG